jgi:3-methyladenine DNA glycosylase AlkD
MSAVSRRAGDVAGAFTADVVALQSRYTPHIRALRRSHSKAWKNEPAKFVTEVALALNDDRRHRWQRWFAYELIRFHKGAFAALNDRTLSRLAKGLDSWDSVDAYGRILTGAAWAQGLCSDALIDRWSKSKDLWHRRLALVSTIGLNMPADGGKGDTKRTLAICARLADDHEDMIEKAESWALRVLIAQDAKAVRTFVTAHPELGPRVKREVANKLKTGLKNPKKS